MVPQPAPTKLHEGGNTGNDINSMVDELSDKESNSDSDATLNGDEDNLVVEPPPSELEGANIASEVCLTSLAFE